MCVCACVRVRVRVRACVPSSLFGEKAWARTNRRFLMFCSAGASGTELNNVASCSLQTTQKPIHEQHTRTRTRIHAHREWTYETEERKAMAARLLCMGSLLWGRAHISLSSSAIRAWPE